MLFIYIFHIKWTTDFPREDIDREDDTGLEFDCQYSIATLTRLYQLKRLGRTNTVAPRRILQERQDLIRMGADDFLEEGNHTKRGEWCVRATAEECTRHCIQCRRVWSATQVDPEGWCTSCKEDKPEEADRNNTATARHIGLPVRSALPEELDLLAVGGNVKETVMTIPFLLTCISHMIGDLERKHTSDGNKRRAMSQPEAPWDWFTGPAMSSESP